MVCLQSMKPDPDCLGAAKALRTDVKGVVELHNLLYSPQKPLHRTVGEVKRVPAICTQHHESHLSVTTPNHCHTHILQSSEFQRSKTERTLLFPICLFLIFKDYHETFLELNRKLNKLWLNYLGMYITVCVLARGWGRKETGCNYQKEQKFQFSFHWLAQFICLYFFSGLSSPLYPSLDIVSCQDKKGSECFFKSFCSQYFLTLFSRFILQNPSSQAIFSCKYLAANTVANRTFLRISFQELG